MLSFIRRCAFITLVILSSSPAMAQDDVPAPQLVADMDNATTIWDNACAACHGELGQGVEGAGPGIRDSKLSLSEIMLVVKAGRNTMPAFAGFTQQEVLDVSTYVKDQL
jgi:mono/diheme cytochrome c family protein